MKGKLWCLRLTLLLVVSALVFSPLVVRGASISSQPVGWNHDPSVLLLPSSPTYPAVVAYRDIRIRMSDRSFEKSELLLGFANEDAASINTMARRQDFVTSAGHSSTYQHTFDCCVGWLVIANERGNDVSYLLARVKNDHMAQQVALSHALGVMPEWSHDSVEAARTHAATVLLEAIALLEGAETAGAYRALMTSALPELNLPEIAAEPAPPSVVVVPPASSTPEEEQPVDTIEDATAPVPPEIVSFSAGKSRVGYGDQVNLKCSLASGNDGLSFSWWCSRGELTASGNEAVWTAPAWSGVCEINVTVSDPEGNRDSESLQIRVKEDDSGTAASTEGDGFDEPSGDEPVGSANITLLDFSADHKYFEESGSGSYAILVGRACTITCVVDEPRDIDFDWSVTGNARIDGSGDTVTLTVPSSPGYVTVTVTTTNDVGETDTASATLYVSTCTYCF